MSITNVYIGYFSVNLLLFLVFSFLYWPFKQETSVLFVLLINANNNSSTFDPLLCLCTRKAAQCAQSLGHWTSVCECVFVSSLSFGRGWMVPQPLTELVPHTAVPSPTPRPPPLPNPTTQPLHEHTVILLLHKWLLSNFDIDALQYIGCYYVLRQVFVLTFPPPVDCVCSHEALLKMQPSHLSYLYAGRFRVVVSLSSFCSSFFTFLSLLSLTYLLPSHLVTTQFWSFSSSLPSKFLSPLSHLPPPPTPPSPPLLPPPPSSTCFAWAKLRKRKRRGRRKGTPNSKLHHFLVASCWMSSGAEVLMKCGQPVEFMAVIADCTEHNAALVAAGGGDGVFSARR